MTAEDPPLNTQTTAPPIVPPRRPLIAIAMADGNHDWLPGFQELAQQLATLRDRCDAMIAAHLAVEERLRSLLGKDERDTN
jgi:hypothetical protein